MRTIRLLSWSLLVLLVATTALAQYPLYGAPDVLRLPQAQANQAYQTPQAGSVAAPAYGSAYGSAMTPSRQPQLAPPSGPVPQPEAETIQPNLVTQMLAENGCAPVTSQTCMPNDGGPSCGPIDCVSEYCCPWFASFSYLTMGRDKANRFWTTYNADDEEDQMTNTGDIDMAWGNGGEVRFGRRFCCGCTNWGIEAVYWTMKPVHGYLSTTSTTGTQRVSTPMDFGFIDIDGASGNLFFDNAAEHRLWRRNEFHNIEINLLGGRLAQCSIPSWNVQWILGVRYFRFDEDLRFGSVQGGHSFGEAGGIYEAYLDDQIKNSLVGVQLGFDARSNPWHKLQLYVAPKVGIYNNYIENSFAIYQGDGTNATSTSPAGSYPVRASDNVFSSMLELDMGLYWNLTENWSAQIGYRLVAISGLGLADHQFLHYVNDIPEIQHVKYNGDLLLHGAHAGITFNY